MIHNMKQYRTIAELKSDTKEALAGKYGVVIGAIVTTYIVMFILSSVISGTANPGSASGIFLVQAEQLLVEILMGLFTSGLAYVNLNVVYRQNTNFSDLFYGMKQQPDKALLIQAVLSLILFAGGLPSFAYSLLYGERASVPMFLLLRVGFGLLSLIIYLMLSQSFYIMHDFPERSVPRILSSSMYLMRGNLWRLIKLMLSFLPLMLLGIVTFFLPLLWVRAYI